MKKLYFLFLIILLQTSLLFPQQYNKWQLPEHWDLAERFWEDIDQDGNSELILVHQRKLQVWSFQNPSNTKPKHEYQIPAEYINFNISKLKPDEPVMLYLLGSNGVDQITLTPESRIEKIILFEEDYSPNPQWILLTDFLVDLNNDQIHEVIIPSKAGFKLYKLNQGQWEVAFEFGENLPPQFWIRNQPFEKGMLMGSSFKPLQQRNIFRGNIFSWESQPVIYTSQTRWPLSSIEIKDWNQDGLKDLVLRNAIALQTTTGSFTINPHEKIPVDLAIETKNLDSIGMLIDINGDKFEDEIHLKTEGDIVLPKTVIKVFLHPGQTVKKEVKPFTLRTANLLPGTNIDSALVDVNLDGKLDLTLIHFEISAASSSSMIESFLDRGIKSKLYIYFWGDEEGFGKKPDIRFPMVLRYDMFGIQDVEGGAFQLGHDFNGDGRTDLASKSGPDSIDLHLMKPDGKSFDENEWYVLQTPFKIENYKLRDLNNDNRADFTIVTKDPDKQGRYPAYVFYSK